MNTAVIERETQREAVPLADTPATPAPRRFTVAEYLAIDEAAERRSEFIAGEIVPMPGASRVHVRIVTNIVYELQSQVMGRPCDVFSNDTRVRATNYYYPDAGVVCGDYLVDNRQLDTLTNPTVLIEVQSPSTHGVDRGVKLRDYLRLPSLRTYLLVSQDAALIEQHERAPDGEWRVSATQGLNGVVALPAIRCRLAMEAVYRRVPLDEASDDEPDASVGA